MISIVDDDEGVRLATGQLVRALGYAVATFASAEDFLNSGRTKEMSCVIADVCMPGLTGIDLLKRVKADGHRCPVILMTSTLDDEMREPALAAGAHCILAKPYYVHDMIRCIDSAIAAYRRVVR